MTNQLTQQNENYVARYTGGRDPYTAFANEGGPGIQGRRLSCKKGVWGIGSDDDPVKRGTRYLAIVPTSMRGFLKWVGGVCVDHFMELVSKDLPMPHRNSLGDLDEGQWEKDPDGKPRDPWSRCFRVLLIEMAAPHGDVTFSGSSYGAQLGLQGLCGAYGQDRHLHSGDAFPVVELDTKPWVSRRYGKQTGPWFNIVGWATVEDVKAGRKAGAAATPAPAKKSRKAAKASEQDTGAIIDDEIAI